jgi:hypothetical protein
VRRPVAYLVAWVVATAVTVGLSSLGIRSVLVAAAPSRTRPLSAAELRLVAPTSAAALPSPTPSPTPSPSPSSSPSASPSLRPSPSDTWAPSPDGQGGTGFKRTFHTTGGDATFWCAKGVAQVLSVIPKPGYAVNVTREGPESVLVSFTNNRKISRILARWWNGPYAEISESVV